MLGDVAAGRDDPSPGQDPSDQPGELAPVATGAVKGEDQRRAGRRRGGEMDISGEAWRRSREGDERFQVTQAIFAFVVIDAEGRPRPVPEREGA